MFENIVWIIFKSVWRCNMGTIDSEPTRVRFVQFYESQKTFLLLLCLSESPPSNNDTGWTPFLQKNDVCTGGRPGTPL